MRRLALIPLVFSFIVGCTGKRSQPPVPRPQAWPRVEVYPPSYHKVNNLMVNDSALVEPGSAEGWFDIVYPAYNARINCTLTSAPTPDALAEAIDNRLERLERNVAGAEGELTSLTSDGGIGCMMIVAPGAVATPVQFLATDSVSRLLSGTVVFASPSLKPDSVAPAVEAVERDVLYLLTHLETL